jgi:hypothetical protein
VVGTAYHSSLGKVGLMHRPKRICHGGDRADSWEVQFSTPKSGAVYTVNVDELSRVTWGKAVMPWPPGYSGHNPLRTTW